MAEVVAGGVYVMVMSGGIDDELDIMWPLRSGVGHVDFLPIAMVVGVTTPSP